MFNANGWIIIRSSREKYAEAEIDMDALKELTKEDELVWDQFEDYLKKNHDENTLFKMMFFRHLNNESGILNFTLSRNHYADELYELLDWITDNAKGSYGIVYIYDDESEYYNEFRVIKINKGECTEHDDPFLSPMPSKY